MANPMILKCCPTRYMLFITILHSAAYLLFTFLWMPMFGLYGFCYAAIAANTGLSLSTGSCGQKVT